MPDFDHTTFLSGANAGFIADLYARYLDDPDALDPSWRRFFGELADDPAAVRAEAAGPAWARSIARANGSALLPQAAAASPEAVRQAALDSIRALNLIRAYRVRGHLEADLDPLGLEQRRRQPELDYRDYGFTEADLDREIFINNLLGLERATLREILARLRAIYCGHIGVEYMHIQVQAERLWIQQKFENLAARSSPSRAVQKDILKVLTEAEVFERLLERRYPGTKRFGIEGAESLMPALEAILRLAPNLASPNSYSACRIAAGSMCWPISWGSRSSRSFPNSRARPVMSNTSRAPATSNITSAPPATARLPAATFTCHWPPTRRTWKR